MRIALFDNPKNALIFGGGILLAAVVLIGEEDDEGALTSAATESSYEARMASKEQMPSGSKVGIREYVSNDSREAQDDGPGWESDSDFIDDASGSDATPTDNTPASIAGDGHIGGPPGIDGPET